MELSQRSRRLIGRLRSRRSRTRDSLVLVEGVRAVGSALDAEADVRFAVTSPRLDSSPAGAALHARLWSEGLEVRAVTDRELSSVSDTEASQGVLLVVVEPPQSLSALRSPGRFLMLDSVQDPGNAGTLVRAASAFDLDGVIALDGTVDLWSSKCVRAAAGLGFSLPLIRSDIPRALEHFRAGGVDILVAASEGQDVHDFQGCSSFALVVGNEGTGVRREISDVARAKLAVPMPGPAESLNVGVAASIIMYSLFRKRARE